MNLPAESQGRIDYSGNFERSIARVHARGFRPPHVPPPLPWLRPNTPEADANLFMPGRASARFKDNWGPHFTRALQLTASVVAHDMTPEQLEAAVLLCADAPFEWMMLFSLIVAAKLQGMPFQVLRHRLRGEPGSRTCCVGVTELDSLVGPGVWVLSIWPRIRIEDGSEIDFYVEMSTDISPVEGMTQYCTSRLFLHCDNAFSHQKTPSRIRKGYLSDLVIRTTRNAGIEHADSSIFWDRPVEAAWEFLGVLVSDLHSHSITAQKAAALQESRWRVRVAG